MTVKQIRQKDQNGQTTTSFSHRLDPLPEYLKPRHLLVIG